MARNRKSEGGFRLAPALTALALCAIFVTMGIGYVWFKSQIGVLGDQIKKREVSLAELVRQNRIRHDQLATLCSPVALDDRVTKLKLGLGPPALAQVIHMTETPGQPPVVLRRPVAPAETRAAPVALLGRVN